MRRMILMAVLMLTPLAVRAADPARPQPRPVAGVVSAVDPASRTLTVVREQFVVPADVYDLSSLAEGQFVIVHWQGAGRRRVATRVEVDPTAD